MNILTHLRNKLGAEDGATATEYVFLLVFIAIAIIAGATFLGNTLDQEFSDAANSVSSATN